MILSFLFIFFLLLESLLLPAIAGPKPILIIPLFALGIAAYTQNSKFKIAQALLFLLIAEIFLGVRLGNYILPFILTALIYIWLNQFIGITEGLKEGSNPFFSIIAGGLTITTLVFFYSFIFMLFQYRADFYQAWNDWLIFIETSGYQTFAWALAFSVLFKYILKKT